MTRDPNFNYHPKCEKLGITHIMFADDLLLFSRGDLISVQLLFEAFQKFSSASGLVANLDKSDVYFGGLTDSKQDTLQEALGMNKGSLPFRYLGVPLSAKKLTISQCFNLSRVCSLEFKLIGLRFLFFQRKNIREIESKFRCFLWTGNGNPSKKALVAWKFMSLPKSCGGWNITFLEDWNNAAITKILWDISHKSENLWVKWIHTYYFANKDSWTTFVP
ncbi:uncharacterized protein LOC110683220, partial [Chenopodium quinoa]|uniref:uncharacterized protein LOC110683220 n=1 Tax=Chenopodium quinoa TaxID=63459 RepID=UPI000B7953A4